MIHKSSFLLAAALFTVLISNVFAGDALKSFTRKDGWKFGVSKKVKALGGDIKEDAGIVKIKHPDGDIKKYELQLSRQINLEIGRKYRLQFSASASRSGIVEIVYGTAKPPYRTYYRGWVKVSPDKHKYEILLDIKKNEQGKFEPERSRLLRLYFGANRKMDTDLDKLSIKPLDPLQISRSWKLFLHVKSPQSYAAVPLFLPGRNREKVVARQVELNNCTIDLASIAGRKSSEGDKAVLYNEFNLEEAGNMRLGFAADWWMEIYVNGHKVYSTMTTGNRVNSFVPSDHVIKFPVKKGRNIIAVKVISGSKGWKFVCGDPVRRSVKPEQSTIKINSGAVWKAVDTSSLLVKPGSALDLSNLIDAPAGRYGRLIVNRNGDLAFADRPLQAVRLRGFNGVPRAVWQYSSDKDFSRRAKIFAGAARRQGYRILRTNMLDCLLSSHVTGDKTINEKYLRRWDLLFAELKKQGIYIHFVIASYGLYYSPFAFGNETFKKRNEHKLRMVLGEKSERDHWKFGAEYLLNHVNPYTGLKWKDDPVIAVVEFYNEQENGVRKVREIITADSEIRLIVERKWRGWLKHRYSGKLDPKIVKELNGVDLAKAPVPDMRGDRPELANQFSLFIGELAKENADWFTMQVRRAGYTGLVTQYNFSKKLIFSAVRWEVAQVVEMNGYFCHPYNNQVDQASSIARRADYWRGINSTRLSGRPFLVTEFNHAFWNKYQHECGLVVGAYSALQGFASIMIHSGPVELRVNPKGVRNFTCSSSPVVRASEFLAGCLFQRGDVRKALKNVEMQIPLEYLRSAKHSDQPVNSTQSELALITGFSLAFAGLPKPPGPPAEIPKPTLIVPPAGGGSIGGDEWASFIIESESGVYPIGKMVSEMKKSGMLPAANISDPDKGIFQSDTGEITMHAKEQLLTVVTPRTEAVSLTAGKSVSLKCLEVKKSNVDATIAVCSVDNKTLESSGRMVLIYSTEVANSGTELSHDRKKMLQSGKLPILMKTGRIELTIKHSGGKIALYALNLDGSRAEKLPLEIKEGKLIVKLNTAALKNGPTSFFELAEE